MGVDQMSRERARPMTSGVASATGVLARGGWVSGFSRVVPLQRAGELVSAFRVTDMATAAIGAAGASVAELLHAATGTLPAVRVDRRMASLWFGTSRVRKAGRCRRNGIRWPATIGRAIAGSGCTRTRRIIGWRVVGARCAADAQSVAQAVNRWDAGALEEAIVERGGCAAAMYSAQEWAGHPQGNAVATEPLLHVRAATDASRMIGGLRKTGRCAVFACST